MEHLNFYYGDNKKKQVIIGNRNITETIAKAKIQTNEIKAMKSKVDDVRMQMNIGEIGETADKIINTIEGNPKKIKRVESFFDYYLPSTINILKRYDEIENQRLISSDSKKFMEHAQKLIEEVEKAFKSQLASMYQNDIVDTDAEMKVLDMMLKSEGLGTSGIETKDNPKEE